MILLKKFSTKDSHKEEIKNHTGNVGKVAGPVSVLVKVDDKGEKGRQMPASS